MKSDEKRNLQIAHKTQVPFFDFKGAIKYMRG